MADATTQSGDPLGLDYLKKIDEALGKIQNTGGMYASLMPVLQRRASDPRFRLALETVARRSVEMQSGTAQAEYRQYLDAAAHPDFLKNAVNIDVNDRRKPTSILEELAYAAGEDYDGKVAKGMLPNKAAEEVLTPIEKMLNDIVAQRFTPNPTFNRSIDTYIVRYNAARLLAQPAAKPGPKPTTAAAPEPAKAT